MAEREISRFKSSRVSNSITNSESTVYDDTTQPFTLTQWVAYSGNEPGSTSDYVEPYNQYLQNWRTVKGQAGEYNKLTSRGLYIRFLKDLIVTGLTAEERRYLRNVDWTNAIEANEAVTIYSKKIRDMINIIYKNRHPISFEKIKQSMKGSSKGLEKAIFDDIIKLENSEGILSSRVYEDE